LKDGDSKAGLERLRFLIDAGYLADASGTIKTLILSGKYGSQLTVPSSPTALAAIVKHDTPTIIKEVIRVAAIK
jgi:hypothetical protein